ncbi:MAG: c-type cytochrome [Thermodesulfobacteriota bacterium]
MRRIIWIAVFTLAVSFAGSAIAADGRAIFMSKCKNCHGADRMGGTLAPRLKGSDFIQGDPEEIKNTILTGRTGTQKRYRHLPMSMPRFVFTVEELDAIVRFLKDEEGAASGAAGMDGAVIYANKCKMCHMHEGRGGSMAPKLAASHFIRGDADAVKEVILNGRSGSAKHSNYPMSMPKFHLSVAELDALVEYLQSL